MGYNMSTNLSFDRIHICHHCGHPFEYRIQKHLATNDVSSESSGVSNLQEKAAQAVEQDILKIRCPYCQQFQNSMMNKSMRVYCFWVIVILIITLVSGAYLTNRLRNGTNQGGFLVSYCLFNITPAVLILIPIFMIREFFHIKPAMEFFGNNEETYRATHKYYRSLQIFLICTLPTVFIPWIGGVLGVITLSIFSFRIFRMPSYIAHQGFPIFSKDIQFHR